MNVYLEIIFEPAVPPDVLAGSVPVAVDLSVPEDIIIKHLHQIDVVVVTPVPDQGGLNLRIVWVRSIAHP